MREAGSSMGSSTIESRFIINNLTGSKLPSDFRPACQAAKKFRCGSVRGSQLRCPVVLELQSMAMAWGGAGITELARQAYQASAGPYSYFWCRSARPLDFPLLLKLPVPADQLPVLLLPSFCSGRPQLMMLRISSPHNCIYK